MSPHAPSITPAGWASSSPPASWVPISCLPFSFTACSCGCHPLCLLYGTGISLPQPPTRVVHFTPFPHRPPGQLDLCPVSCSFRALSPPAHRLATPCTSHTVPLSTVATGFLVTNRILTRRASCASGRLSAHLSSMCLLGLIVKCVLSRGCCPPHHPALLSSILDPRGSLVRLGHSPI